VIFETHLRNDGFLIFGRVGVIKLSAALRWFVMASHRLLAGLGPASRASDKIERNTGLKERCIMHQI